MALVTVVLLGIVVVLLVTEALPAVRQVGFERFFADAAWHPDEGSFGITSMLAATAATTLGAILLGGAVAIGSAVCAGCFMPNSLVQLFDSLMGVLAGIPSVVIGLWGVTHLVPLIASHAPPGSSLLAGILVLSMMVLPTIYLGSVAALRSIPRHLTLSRQILCISKGAFTRHIALPLALPGIGYSIILGVSRCVGEAMALIMVSGNIPAIPQSLFDPVRTLAANMALEMAYATDMHRSALYVSSGLLLFIIIVLAVATRRAAFTVSHV